MLNQSCLNAYRENPDLIEEHHNIEVITASGGYGGRQLFELIQNAADQMLEEPGRVEVLLTEDVLYCSNQGLAIDYAGVRALLFHNMSTKRSDEIGRFGAGFKSLLNVGHHIDFLSRSAAFRFDEEWARDEITRVVPGVTQTPVLRLALTLDAAELIGSDPHLQQMASWASTIIRIRLTEGVGESLSRQLRTFPSPFLLFAPHVEDLVIRDLTTGLRRDVRLERLEGDDFRLTDRAAASVWRVFSTTCQPTEAARHDAGDVIDRSVVPIMWAVPTDARTGPGAFWAFFPTEFQTTLSGILNSPWKTNQDRLNLLPGPFNQELLGAAAGFIVDCIPRLLRPDDPAKFLEMLPARGKEGRNWADDVITNSVYEFALHKPSLPDQSGALRLPEELSLHPDDIPPAALELWSSAPSRPLDWCHPSVDMNKERRSRAERLAWHDDFKRRPDATAWLEALVTGPDSSASCHALLVAGALLDSTSDEKASERTAGSDWMQYIKRSRILTTGDLRVVRPIASEVFLPGEYQASGVTVVHPEIAADERCRSILERLGIKHFDRTAELLSLLRRARSEPNAADWDHIWRLVREVEGDVAALLKAERVDDVLRVRTVAGSYSAQTRVLLPGPIVPPDGGRDADVAVDVQTHSADLGLIQALGVSRSPEANRSGPNDVVYSEYLNAAKGQYYAQLDDQSPYWDFLEPIETNCAGPLELLPLLSAEGAALFTEALLNTQPTLEPWHMHHRTRREYPTVEVEPPVLWAIRRYGRLKTSKGFQPVDKTVGPTLDGWSSLLPVGAFAQKIADDLGLPKILADVPDDLVAAALQTANESDDDAVLGRFYVAVADRMPRPAHIWSRVGPTHEWREPGEVAAAVDQNEFEALLLMAAPFVRVESAGAASALVDKWQLLRAAELVHTDVAYVEVAAEAPVVDAFPGLARHLGEFANLTFIRCASLRIETATPAGKHSRDATFEVRDGRVFFVGDDDRQLLQALSLRLGLELRGDVIEDVLAQRRADAQRERLRAVREAPTLEERLIVAVGEQAIRAHLPGGLVESIGQPDANALARMAFAVFGVEVLQEFKVELANSDLDPPKNWAASDRAKEFVEALGFEPEYAGFEPRDQSPLLEVLGPADLPSPHDYQVKLMDEMRRVLPPNPPSRALLSLPTGAGKTRIAVEAIIRCFLEKSVQGPVLWVAQSDELCEQAVQTWSFIWRAIGLPQKLSISRLWTIRHAAPVTGPHVVVATIQKLTNLFEDEEYRWLSRPACIVIDEAHLSTETSYSRLLEWAGFSPRTRDMQCALVGLTATPFKGVDEAATKTLIRRYDGHRLDHAVFGDQDVYADLQRRKVLSRARHEVLDGVRFELSDEDLESLKVFGRLPASVEQSIGRDVDRNERILKRISEFPSDWTSLVFASSVDHSKTLAALLQLAGIPSVAISSETNYAARRFYIEEFRQKRIRVLTNYGVLSQGFDAPSVNAVIVARPTYSPTTYQQMIGRGLRGPLNGGTEECLIVDMSDNLERYQGELAFRAFEPLWTQ